MPGNLTFPLKERKRRKKERDARRTEFDKAAQGKIARGKMQKRVEEWRKGGS